MPAAKITGINKLHPMLTKRPITEDLRLRAYHSLRLSALFCLMLLQSACSLSLSPSTEATSIELPTAKVAEAGHDIKLISTSPYTYRLNGDLNAFLSVFRECGLDHSVSQLSTTRELFVGFEQLSIENQSKIEIEQQLILQTLASAAYDKIPIRLAAFSLRDGECVLDYVFWNPNQEESVPSQLMHFQQFVGSTLAFAQK